MAKKSKIAKHEKQKAVIAKFAAKRAELKAIINGKAKSVDEYNEARQKLADLPRDSNPTRLHNRCQLTGRPRGYYRDFGLCRNQLRQLAHEGKLPGVVKSSW
ncbi:MAG: 30S ribosomal protein S14 [Candidatus Sericytochromatia bacterium]|jgi:small subunit ribosomal protein S14|nr:30S ribosomal protein S14 [Candidatus Sericytochromatia bacterium]